MSLLLPLLQKCGLLWPAAHVDADAGDFHVLYDNLKAVPPLLRHRWGINLLWILEVSIVSWFCICPSQRSMLNLRRDGHGPGSGHKKHLFLLLDLAWDITNLNFRFAIKVTSLSSLFTLCLFYKHIHRHLLCELWKFWTHPKNSPPPLLPCFTIFV